MFELAPPTRVTRHLPDGEVSLAIREMCRYQCRKEIKSGLDDKALEQNAVRSVRSIRRATTDIGSAPSPLCAQLRCLSFRDGAKSVLAINVDRLQSVESSHSLVKQSPIDAH